MKHTNNYNHKRYYFTDKSRTNNIVETCDDCGEKTKNVYYHRGEPYCRPCAIKSLKGRLPRYTISHNNGTHMIICPCCDHVSITGDKSHVNP